jgi:tetratricopeptide (TPR) repeat protein
LYSKINYVFRSGRFTRNETERKVVEQISEYHLIKGKNTAISVRATSICYYIQGLCAASNRDYETALINFRKTKAILDKNQKIKTDLPNRYIYTLNFLMHCYLDNNDFKNAEKMQDELCCLEDLKAYKSLDSEVKIFSTAAIGKMQILNRQGRFSEALREIPDIDAKVEKYAEKLNKEKILLIDYSKAYTYFGVGDFKQSLKLINGVLNDNEKQLRQDVYSFSRIFNLVIHFELGNYDFIEYESKSTSRFLNKHEKDYQIEKVFMKYIKKIAKEDFGPDKKTIFEDFYAEVDELMKDPSEQVILEYFDVKAWLYSKIKRKEFTEVLHSNN